MGIVKWGQVMQDRNGWRRVNSGTAEKNKKKLMSTTHLQKQ